MLTDTIIFQQAAPFLSLGKKVSNLVNPYDQAILSHWL